MIIVPSTFRKQFPSTHMYLNISDLLSHHWHRDGNVLFPYQSGTALTSATILDELDKTKKYKHDSGKAKDTILEDMGFRLESKELHRRESIWDTAGLHPLLVACDSSTLCFVDEFSQRDVSVVAKDMNIFESPSTVLEFDA